MEKNTQFRCQLKSPVPIGHFSLVSFPNPTSVERTNLIHQQKTSLFIWQSTKVWIIYCFVCVTIRYDKKKSTSSVKNHIIVAKCISERGYSTYHFDCSKERRRRKNEILKIISRSEHQWDRCHRFIDSIPRTKQTTKLSSFNSNQSVYEFGMRAIRYTLSLASEFTETGDTSGRRMRRHFNFHCVRVPIHSGKRRKKI